MVYKKLSEEDKIIIKYLRQRFGYGAKRISKDHPEKNWALRNVGNLLKKIDEAGDVKRQEGSGRPKSSRTENNINAVKELISSQEDKPRTHATRSDGIQGVRTASYKPVLAFQRTRSCILLDIRPVVLNLY